MSCTGNRWRVRSRQLTAAVPRRACHGHPTPGPGLTSADGHVGATVQFRDEGGQIAGVQRAVAVDDGNDGRGRGLDARVHGGAVTGLGLGDDAGAAASGHVSGAVGAVVVDDEGDIPIRHGGKHARQGLRLVEARQNHRDATVGHEGEDNQSACDQAR